MTKEANAISAHKLAGRALYESIGSPRYIVAPMVEHSELAWRILSRRYGADLCYTPMFHARLFATSPKYRQENWCDADGSKFDRPLIVQFCANDPQEFLDAARMVVGQCDAVDLNLGCPQGIARRGNYGAFLQENWTLIHDLISKLHNELEVPVTAKFRILDTPEKSLEYARMIVEAGAQFVTIHGRTREMKGQNTGIANLERLKFLRNGLGKEQVMFANGNVVYPGDADLLIEATCADGAMSAEGNLYNPAIFRSAATCPSDVHLTDWLYPRVDKVCREYIDIVKSVPQSAVSKHVMKSHLFKILRPFLPMQTDIRAMLGKSSPRHDDWSVWDSLVKAVEERVSEILSKPENAARDLEVYEGPLEEWGGRYKDIAYWRCQPYFRTVNGQTPGYVKPIEEPESVKRSASPESVKRPASPESVKRPASPEEFDSKRAKMGN
ncbi:hypothetical protein CANCADRAFT_148099 [Tortispora caseinolytica NRRL Y-17796]|uniref:tRNA-dihydrouridine(16/17) synthase [NAD(P)(+)] n=1 Tax=Tortispora caseinolytica NRRL Y-17796 TaxID=767744 RepID=A0A1E4TGH3_9ASCO|nr:hypothetical protein CANCADRAFT_148099 [Tortispora caseinolytica NRRL Y-17796]